ncbi:MAG: superoxide dismutase, Ni [Euryarchaeota archaeon]|nr:superoxide dismutase, Ni [Euryarchaeota archaeon]MDE1880011.1 superoxide dismutase, Ni [Euryarchaeota archaeon]MDE2046160.1 superoxide dismutase, Ni [Thermoplasmata archaeon]
MSALSHLRTQLASALDAIVPPATVYAHCDIPCGIYDPHEAQIAALTVIRMNQLIGELKPPAADAKPEERTVFVHKLARYTAIKEQHAERVKHEVRVIWGDYFTPDMVKAHPQATELVFKIMKCASKARQEASMASAEELNGCVQEFAELFWKTKDTKTARLPSHQKAGGTLVVPTA